MSKPNTARKEFGLWMALFISALIVVGIVVYVVYLVIGELAPTYDTLQILATILFFLIPFFFFLGWAVGRSYKLGFHAGQASKGAVAAPRKQERQPKITGAEAFEQTRSRPPIKPVRSSGNGTLDL